MSPGPGAPCRLCGGSDTRGVAELRARPAGEADYGIPDERYAREIRGCETCGVFFNHHRLLPRDLYRRAHNDATYGDGFLARYRRIRGLPAGESDNKQRVRRVIERLAPAGKRAGETRVLDVGTGLCVFLAELVDAGYACVAIDPDPRAARHASEEARVAESHAGTLATYAGGRRFDLVAFNRVLEHVEDPVGQLVRARGLLAAGGEIYLELPDGEAAAAHEGASVRQEFFVEHLCVYTPRAFRWLVERAGLRCERVEAIREPSGKYSLYGFLQPAG